MKNDLISRREAIRWVKTECNPYGKPTLEYESGKKVIEHLEAMPSAQPDLDSAYTEGYTAAESKYRKMWDEMQATKQDAVEDAWDMFKMISSAWYGKGCYSKQDDGSVYSRLSCRYMTFDDAVREFMEEIDDD